MMVKALTLWQPYASLIMAGLKRYETRSWSTQYRGPLVIHAAKRWDSERKRDTDRVRILLQQHGAEEVFSTPMENTLGCALGVVDLVSCRQMDDGGSELENTIGTFGPGRYGWECELLKVFESPVADTGKQGLWVPSEEVLKFCHSLRRDHE